MNDTTLIDQLRVERDDLKYDMRGISPKLSLYKELERKHNALSTRINELVQKRDATRRYKAGYGVETIQGSALMPAPAAV